MPDTQPVDRPPAPNPRPASNPSFDLSQSTGGDDWLCLSWLDRSEFGPTIKRPSNDRPTLAGYEIMRELGQGGMGIIYLARDLQLKRRVAIKVMREGLIEATAVERFRAEAQAIGRLQHPNIVQIHETGDFRGRPFLVLEYVAGPNLHQVLDGKPMLPRNAAELLEPIARAVQHAHERGIVHRDLKPGNILLAPEVGAVGADDDPVVSIPPSEFRIPKVTDFGVAKLREQKGELTETGSVIGTPNYMAPEQTDSSRQAGPEADIYSIGATFYEMLTGRPPFNAVDPVETLIQARNRDPVPPRQLQPNVPRDLETICLKCLRKDPKQRYSSAGELADDVRRFLEGRPIKARPIDPFTRSLRWVRRNPALASLVAAVAVGVVALIGFSAILASANRREQSSRQKAELSRDQVLSSADELLERFAQSSRLHQADLNDIRADLLASAVPHYEYFVKLTDGDQSQDPQRARAFATLGFLHRELGKLNQAVDEYAAACETYEALASRFPAQVEYQRGLAVCSLRRGIALVQLSRPLEAKKELIRCQKILELLTSAAAPDPKDIVYLAECKRELGNLKSGAKLDRGAGDQLRDAVAMLQSLIEKRPEFLPARELLAYSRIDLGRHLLDSGENDAASRQFHEASAESQRLASDAPLEPDYRLLHVRALAALGEFQRRTKDFTSCEKNLKVAQAAMDALCKEFKSNPEYRVQEARCIFATAQALAESPGQGDALAAVHNAIRRQEQLVAESPKSCERAVDLAISCELLATLYIRQGRFEDALTWQNRCIAQCEAALSQDSKWEGAKERLGSNLARRGETLERMQQYKAAARDFDRALRLQEVGTTTDALRREATMAWALAGDTDWALPDSGSEVLAAARQLIQRSSEAKPDWPMSEKQRAQHRDAAISLLKLAYEQDRLKEDDFETLATAAEFKSVRQVPRIATLIRAYKSKQ